MNLPLILEAIKNNKEQILFNKKIFDISEGNLLKYVVETIKKQIKRPESAEKMIERIPPINILNKIVNRLSTIYSKAPGRQTTSQDAIDWYSWNFNKVLSIANKNFNRYKSSFVKIYEDEKSRELKIRAIPSWQCLPISYNNDLNIDAIAEFVRVENKKNIFWIYTKDEFLSITEDGEVVGKDMPPQGWINPFGVIPFSYLTSSENLLIPIPDKDLFSMTILVPMLLSEINFGSQYLSNPIIYGVDLNLGDGTFSRNADTVLMFKTSDGTDKSGTLQVLQPAMDISSQLMLVKDQLDFWLSTRDIRPGSVGGTQETLTSGISLMIRNMDATANIQTQMDMFKDFEFDLWNKVAVIHNMLMSANRIDTPVVFRELNDLSIQYQMQDLIESPSEQINNVKAQIDAGLLSKETAIKELHKDWTDEQVQEEIAKIKMESSIEFTA